MGCFIQDWVPQDLEVSTISVHVFLSLSSAVRSCEATVELFHLSLSQSFIAVSWNCTFEFIKVELGAVNDCYVEEYDRAINDVRMLGSSIIVPKIGSTQSFFPSCLNLYRVLKRLRLGGHEI